ncbi:MAG: SDR family NAD(P)-dependent oxidoreductase [Solirubrobacteraceae bacterium]
MPSVLVTGAARGIGRATALRLAANGWDVVAGVRRIEDGEDLASSSPAPITTVLLDVTSDEQIGSLDAVLPARLDAVVNNAGVVVGGPLEAVSPAELSRQLEINVVGQMAVTQAVLSRIRGARGRVVFVSSLSGRVSSPLFGAYNASKFALEGMADALRMELAPWGIRVVLVEPAQTDTDLWRKADAVFDETAASLSPEYRELYAGHLEGFRKAIPRAQRMAAPVEGVAATIERALTQRRPWARYVVGRSAQVQAVMARLTPTPILDKVLSAATGIPKRRQ